MVAEEDRLSGETVVTVSSGELCLEMFLSHLSM